MLGPHYRATAKNRRHHNMNIRVVIMITYTLVVIIKILTSYSLRNMYSCVTLIFRSVSLNSYLMFHPMGPNCLLSWTTAWKKHSANRSFLKFSGCLFPSNHSGSLMGSLWYERATFARRPGFQRTIFYLKVK